MPDPERLWSPWRMEYIRRRDSGQSDGCLFCDVPAAGEDEASQPPPGDEAGVQPPRVQPGMNLGQVVGAGIADHLRLHLVPRWGGDTNLMPVVGQKVLPELLDETYQRLRPHLAASGPPAVGPPSEPS